MIDSINFKPDDSAPQRQSFDEWVQVPAARAKKDDRCSSSSLFVFRKDSPLCCFVFLCFVFCAVAAKRFQSCAAGGNPTARSTLLCAIRKATGERDRSDRVLGAILGRTLR
jgi:hypothetical protein